MLGENAQEWASKRIGIFFPADTDGTGRDGDLTGQCVSEIKWFLKECCKDIPAPFMARGHAKDFGDSLVNAGLADRVGDVRRGDILVWPYDGGQYGHIEIAMGDGTSFGQNFNTGQRRSMINAAGDLVYAADVAAINDPRRVGPYVAYRVRSYIEYVPANRDRTAEINYLNDMYRQVLGRDVDDSGRAHYLAQIDAGWNWDQIRADLMNSAEGKEVAARRLEEAKEKARELNAAYESETNEIKRLYRTVLEREADDNGVEHYRSQLRNGWNYGMIAQDLYDSAEYKELQAMKQKQAEEKARAEASQKVLEATEKEVTTPEKKEEKADDTTLLTEVRDLLKGLMDMLKRVFHIGQ